MASLARLDGVRGGLLVTPDGLVITAALPPGVPVEALAALGATLGRQLELGATRFAQGAFHTAVFGADEGVLLVGGSHVGFVVLLGERSTDTAALRTALGEALDRLSPG